MLPGKEVGWLYDERPLRATLVCAGAAGTAEANSVQKTDSIV